MKTTTIIDNPKDIPRWFRDMPYSGVETYLSWAAAIAGRLLADMSPKKDWDRCHALLFNSIIDPDDPDDLTEPEHRGKLQILRAFPYPTRREHPIEDLSRVDAYKIAAAILPTGKEAEACTAIRKALWFLFSLRAGDFDFEREIDGFMKSSNIPSIKSVDEVLPDSDINPHITVDLSYDNKILFAEFNKWLLNQRKRYFRNHRPVSTEDLQNWHKFRILQVFDIDLWQKTTNTHINKQVLSDYLWPPFAALQDLESYPPDSLKGHIRKTKVPEVISLDMLTRLRMQIPQLSPVHTDNP